MTAITRRGALIGASAAVAVAGVPGAVMGDDAALLAQVAQFHGFFDAWQRTWAKQTAHRAQVEAMPGCPRFGSSNFSRDYSAFLKAHDAYRHCDESNRCSERMGAIATAIFQTPAQTFNGVFEKFRIAHLATGNYDGDGDEGLEAYQDWEKPWMATVAADFERLLGGMRS